MELCSNSFRATLFPSACRRWWFATTHSFLRARRWSSMLQNYREANSVSTCLSAPPNIYMRPLTLMMCFCHIMSRASHAHPSSQCCSRNFWRCRQKRRAAHLEPSSGPRVAPTILRCPRCIRSRRRREYYSRKYGHSIWSPGS